MPENEDLTVEDIAEVEKAAIVAVSKKGKRYVKVADTENFTFEESITEGDKKLEQEFDDNG